MSTVNWAEVVGKARAAGVDTDGLTQELEALGLSLVPFTTAQAERAGHLALTTKQYGLSLGDRACIALAADAGARVYTADRAWLDVGLDIAIEAVR